MRVHDFHDFDPNFWHLLAAEPETESSFRRWKFIVITILAFVLLGALVAGLGSEVLQNPVATTAPTTVPAHVTSHAVHHG